MAVTRKKYDHNFDFNPYKLEWGQSVSFPKSNQLSEYGNRIYNRYPARSIFLVPRLILAQHINKGLNILDPFMGSGTTAVETIISGNKPYGTEMDPFARLIADVSTTTFSKQELIQLTELRDEILNQWRDFEPFEVPTLPGIERWFKDDDLTQLLKLKSCILSLTPVHFKPFMLISYADCIKPVSLMERQSLKPYISKKYAKETKTIDDSFNYSFDAHFAAISDMSDLCLNNNGINWVGNDATSFEGIDEQIDLAITSPPYINALDYTRCIKVESAMCGLIPATGTQSLHKMQVGHEARRHQTISESVRAIFAEYYDKLALLDKDRANTCLAYFNDIYKNLTRVHLSLKHGGEYHMIIGDNIIRDIPIPTHQIIAQLAQEVGFEWFGYYHYSIKDHRTSIPRSNSADKITTEYVIMLRK